MIAIFPELASAAASGDIELLAVLVRKYFAGKRASGPRVLVSTMVEASGIKLLNVPLDYPGALVVKDEMGRFSVSMLISDKVAAEDRALLMAHLFGHFLLHCQPLLARGDWPNTGFHEVDLPLSRMMQRGEGKISDSAGVTEKADYEADRFAMSLLMPKGMFKRAVEALKSPEKVSAFFAVPVSAVLARAETIGDATSTPVSFLEAEGILSNERERSIPKEKNQNKPPIVRKPVIDPSLITPERLGANSAKRTSEQGVSKSYAARSYRHSATETKQKASGKVIEADVKEVEDQAQPGNGMDRIRELARKLDPSV